MPPITSIDALSYFSSNVITANIANTSNLLISDINRKITDIYNNDLTLGGDLTTTGTIDIRQDLSNDDDFLPERRYPPRALTSLSDNISDKDYGNGLYEVSASSPPYNNNHSFTYGAFYAQYHATTGYNTGVYTNQDFIVPGYLGDWIKLKLPVAIKLTKYGFTKRSDANGLQRAPGQYKIYGSTDNINWTVLVHKTSTITYEANFVFQESITITGTYTYFALVVNELTGNDTVLNFFNFAIYGQEVNKKFSVDASDGSGYFAGDIQVGGDLTTTGTINGISKTILSAKFGVTQVSCSKYQTFFLTNNGYVFACGENDVGKLGDGTLINKTIPVQVLTGEQSHPSGYLSNIVQVSSGNQGTLFLTNTGNVFSCGNNQYGKLGINDNNNDYVTPTPVQVLTGEQSHPSGYLSDIVQISCGTFHSLFLTKSGIVYATGRNSMGQLGVNSYSSAIAPVQVLTGEQLHPSEYLSDIVQVTSGSYVSLFLTKDGTVFGCGRNQHGELGNGEINPTGTDSSLYVKIPTQVLNLSDIIQISCKSSHSLFLTKDGTVFACGNNDDGQLGNGSTDTTGTPTQVKIDESTFLTNIVKLSTGDGAHSMFITTSGAVFACGNNGFGKLGTNGGGDMLFATQVLTGEQGDSSTYLQNITEISTGSAHTIYLTNDSISIVYGAGINNVGQLATIDTVTKNRSVPHVINLNTVLTNYNSGKLITTGNVDVDGSGYFGGELTVDGGLKTTGAIEVRQDLSNDDDFLSEQRYPPRAMTGLTDNISGKAYGNGLYEVSASSFANEDYSNIYNAFYDAYASEAEAYTGGVYQFANYIVPGYFGEWIKLKLPVPIKLTKYGFENRFYSLYCCYFRCFWYFYNFFYDAIFGDSSSCVVFYIYVCVACDWGQTIFYDGAYIKGKIANHWESC